MRGFNLLLISLLTSGSLFSQKWSLKKEVQLPGTPTAYSIDIQSNLYFGFEDGTVLKFDREGNQSLNYSLPNQSSITLIEAQNALKTFLYYFDIQQIVTLDRFNTIPKTYNLSTYDVTLGLNACPSPDENFWVVENNPMRIKKIDPLRNTTILEVQTGLGDSVRFMKTYKNLLLILNQKDLQIFDLFGSKINHIEGIDSYYFQLVNNKVVMASGDQLITIDPFEGTIEKREALPVEGATVCLRTGRYNFIVKESSLLIYN